MKGITSLLVTPVVAALLILIPTIANAASNKIAYSSDASPANGLEIFTMRDNGTLRTKITSTNAPARRPSMCPTVSKIFYDVGDTDGSGSNADIWIVDVDGSNPKRLTNHTEGNMVSLYEADCGPPGPGLTTNKPLVVFSGREPFGIGFKENIWIGRYDQTTESLVDVVALTDDDPNNVHYQVALCQNSHVVWARQYTVEYSFEICTAPILAGPPLSIGTETCFFGVDENDWRPSCNLLGTEIAWARGSEPGTPDEICTMDFNGSHVTCFSHEDDPMNLYDDTKPHFSPGGTQITFASNRDNPAYDVWKMNSNGEGTWVNITNDSDTEDDPVWGAVFLP